MNRLLFPCLLLLSIFSFNVANSQVFAIWTTGSGSVAAYCFTPNVVATGSAGVVAPQAGAHQYSWTIVSPQGCTQTVNQFTCAGTDPTQCDTIVNISYPCCGTYTIYSVAINTVLGTPIATAQALATLICPNTATATANPSVICRGSSSQLTGIGGANGTYTWFPSTGGSIVGNPVVVNPTQNTTYTMVAVAPQGCTVTATVAINVQSATVAVTPTLQTMCAGSPVCFTATANAHSGSSVTPLTSTLSLQWFQPTTPPTQFATGYTTCTPAIAGDYSVVLTHTGSAGTCTMQALASVIIGTNISVTANSSTNSACPGQTIQLTAASIQTAGTSYTWTTPGNVTIVGNPIVVTHSVAGAYVVNVDYFGCPGSATTVPVAHSVLNPTLTTVGGGSICPNSAATLIATGGPPSWGIYTYTFAYLDANNIPTVIPVPSPTAASSFTLVHTPSLGLPATYSTHVVNQLGCVGDAFVIIQEFTINPSFGTAKPAYCNNTQVTFTVGNVGAGASYTASYLNSVGIYTGTSNNFVHTPPAGTIFPKTFSLSVDSGGCKGGKTVTVNVFTMNPVLSASSLSICPSTEFTLYATGGAGTSYSFQTNYSVSVASPTNIIPNPSNSYSIAHTPTVSLPRQYILITDSANCEGRDTLMIGQLDLSSKLSLSVAPSISVCPNRTFTLTANMTSGSTYTFTGPGGTLPNQTANTATSSLNTFPFTYTVQGDSSGCTGIDSITMYLRVLYPQLTATPNPVCSGMPVQLCASGGTNTTYTFLRPTTAFPFAAVVGNANSPAPCVTVTPGPTATTDYTVAVDSVGCQGTGTVQVNIAPGLTITAITSSAVICSGGNATLSVAGATNATYSWSQITGTNNPVPVPGGTSLNHSTAVQGIVVNPTVSTQYVLYAVDPAGCTGTAVVTVSINPTASLNIVVSPATATICNTSATLSASGANSYTWYPSTNMQPSATATTVLVTPPSTQMYTVVGTNNLGCYGSATTQVQVGPQPSVTIVPTSFSVCAGYNATLTAFGANSYTWTSNTFTGSIAQQSVAGGIIPPSTSASFTVIGSNGGTCTHVAVQSIGVQPPLKISVAQSSQTTCIEVNFDKKKSKPVVMDASGAGSYIWQPYDPEVMTYSLGPQTTVRPGASTCYTVTGYTSTCSGTLQICVNVIPQFSMTVTPNLPAICLGDSLKLSITNISTLAVGPMAKFTYSWAEAKNAPPPSLTSEHGGVLSPTVWAFPQNTTTYSVQVNDARGCASLPRLVNVTVFPRPITAIAIPTINNVPTNTVCYVGVHTGPPDVVLTLVAQNKNSNLPFGVVPTYTWLSPYRAPYVSILTPPNSNQITVSAPLRLPAKAIYTVLAGYNGVPGCAEASTVDVHVVDCRPVASVTPPLFQLADNVDTLCSMDCITFVSLTDTMAGGPQTYYWEFEGGSPAVSNEKNPTVCYNLPPTSKTGYNVVLTVTNPYPVSTGGSSRVIGIPSYVKVVDVPAVTIVPPSNVGSDTTVRFGTPLNLTATGALTYSWSPNYNISSTTDSKVNVRPFRTTRYIVKGYNSKHCASSDTINVIVIEDCGAMFVANAFSPNGDGHNDVLKVQGICLETLSFMIFNRWGEKVFETTDQAVGWDGTYKGEQVNTGVFVYRLEGKTYDGKAFSSKGNITLIR